MVEEKILEEIFGMTKKWKNRFEILWCDHCQTFMISCNEPNCHGSTCNAGGCDICLKDEDYKSFDKVKKHIWEYLSDEERKTYEKIVYLKQYIHESISLGETEIDWRRMKEEGKLSQHTEEMFSKEISLLNPPAGEYENPETHRAGCKCHQHNLKNIEGI